MSNEIVYCFNGKECLYTPDCPMYNAALGICRLEPLKTYKVEGVPEKPKRAQAPTPKPQKHIWKIGESAQPMALSIQKAKPVLTLEKIEEMIKTEVAKAGGLLTEEAAAYLVASNLGIGKDAPTAFPTSIPYREEIPEIISTWNTNQYGKSANSADYPELVAVIKASYQERLDYGDFYFKLGGDTDGFINYAERTFRDPDGPPSEGQVKLATQRKITVPADVTKKELSVLISEAELENRRNK